MEADIIEAGDRTFFVFADGLIPADLVHSIQFVGGDAVVKLRDERVTQVRLATLASEPKRKGCGGCPDEILGELMNSANRPITGTDCVWTFTSMVLSVTGTTGPCSGSGDPFYMEIKLNCNGGIIPCASLYRQYWLYSLDANCTPTLKYTSACTLLWSTSNCGWSGTINDCISLPPPIGGWPNGNYKIEYKIYEDMCLNSLDADKIEYVEHGAGNNWSTIGKPAGCP